ASPTATPAPAGEVKAWDIQPKAPYKVGDLVTVVGSGLDQVSSVLIAGSFSADIVEKHPDRIVIRVPANPHGSGGYHYDVSFVVPGRPIVTTLLPITVLATNAPAPAKQAPGVGVGVEAGGPAPADEHALLNQEFTLEGGQSKKFTVATGGLVFLQIDVDSKGGEVEVRVEPIESSAPPMIRATLDGSLRWPLRLGLGAKAEKGPAPPPKSVTISLGANANEKVTGRLVVRPPQLASEFGLRPVKPTPAPSPKPAVKPRKG
ncbi:MAG TPA: IPT/TIG domain-containing protein, partial [Thermoanaerobaculia bacterium]|nr:IPT/TIG domain-containing protein [Thermoanaerobaculia bacterium]